MVRLVFTKIEEMKQKNMPSVSSYTLQRTEKRLQEKVLFMKSRVMPNFLDL